MSKFKSVAQMKKTAQLVREKKFPGKVWDEWASNTDFYHLPKRVKKKTINHQST